MEKITYSNKHNRILSLAPTKIVVLSFALLILTGTLLLMLPIASRDGNSIGFLKALFTSTSASCVTGLVVVDTLTHWTPFGQIVIMCLIQAGGLGIVTLATFFSAIVGKKVGLKGMLLAQESLNHYSFEGIQNLIKRVVLITFGVEFIGALLLSSRFVPRYGLRGLYMGVFHAVSAFCNAGFDLIGDYKSLTEFNGDPVVIYTTALLIIIGGLGFMVWKDLYDFRKTHSLMLHTKVVLIITACLIFFGSLFFFCTEFNNTRTMGQLNLFEKANAAVFHSVTCRTAGFNSLPLNDMREVSKIGSIILMFIGAAPGSTGGGVKVTTFGVLLLAVICQMRGAHDTIIFKKRVPHTVVNKALAIVGLSGTLVITFASIILGIEGTQTFTNMMYEATSAFGTVGLSAAGTPVLHNVTQAMLIFLMFLGRVGPLSFAIALTLRSNKEKPDIVYPEGKIMVG